MSRRRGAGIVPAIGWSLPVFVLATGLSAARADEISDLRANQELLQRRIDQLAQVPPPAPPPGGPGGPVLAGSFPRSFVISVPRCPCASAARASGRWSGT